MAKKKAAHILDKGFKQLKFEGLTINLLHSNLKKCALEGLGLTELKMGQKVRFEGEAIVVGVNYANEDKIGGVRSQVLKAITTRVTETL